MLKQAKSYLMDKRIKNGKTKRSRARKVLEQGGQFIGGLKGLGPLGRYAGTKIADLIGAGSYAIRAPKARRAIRKRNRAGYQQMAPKTGPLDKIFTIQHREYLQDVSTSVEFSSLTYNINPGLNGTFPWLSTLAPCFQKYKFRQLAFQLVSNSAFAVSSTNTALGCWGAVTQVDAADPPLATKQQAENYQGCESCVPARSLTHGVECARRDAAYKWYFVRNGNLGPNEDIKTYDEGVFNYFSQGAQAPSVAGELWVTYTVDFMIPSLPVGGIVSYSDDIYGTAADTSNPLGTATSYNPNNNIGCLTSPTVLSFPATAPQGTYIVITAVTYATSQTVPAINLAPDGVVMQNTNPSMFIFKNQTATNLTAPPSGSTSTTRISIQPFRKVQQAAGSITYSIVHPATATVDVFVTLVNPNLLNTSIMSFEASEYKQLREIINEFRMRKNNNIIECDSSSEEEKYSSKSSRSNRRLGIPIIER